jgi:hypothetical protein
MSKQRAGNSMAEMRLQPPRRPTTSSGRTGKICWFRLQALLLFRRGIDATIA